MDNLCEDFTLHEKHITSAGIHLHMTHWSKPFQDSHRLVCANAQAGRDLFCSPFPSESAPPTGDINNMLMVHLSDLHTSYMVHVFMLLNFNMLRLSQMSSAKWGVCRHRQCYIMLNTTACRSTSQLRYALCALSTLLLPSLEKDLFLFNTCASHIFSDVISQSIITIVTSKMERFNNKMGHPVAQLLGQVSIVWTICFTFGSLLHVTSHLLHIFCLSSNCIWELSQRKEGRKAKAWTFHYTTFQSNSVKFIYLLKGCSAGYSSCYDAAFGCIICGLSGTFPFKESQFFSN